MWLTKTCHFPSHGPHGPGRVGGVIGYHRHGRVEIYLNVHGSRFSFLSVPLSDVQKVTIHPFKWLRFVMYSICGARGDLYATLDGPPVEYDSTAMTLYTSSLRVRFLVVWNCIFVDHKCLNDRITSSTQTNHRANFRQHTLERDGLFCVVTRDPAKYCDAAHLIPGRKGDEYIRRVVEARSPLYDGMTPPISGINAIENGMLLSKTVHAMLGRGDVAFLKVLNYGLDPTDIRRVDQGPAHSPAPTDHFTLQRLKEPDDYNPAAASSLLDTTPASNQITTPQD
ncbi:hypothetical protein BJY52DRAFT_1143807 [Lactarius psammicola]|nr:hypothetical protein BJY52DRAFT_1143807 [Lactarius psammicola]